MARGRGPKPLLDPELKALALAELDGGRTYEEVAADFAAAKISISVNTLKKYRAEQTRQRKRTSPAESTADRLRAVKDRLEERHEDATKPPVPLDTSDLRALLRRQLQDAHERAESARATGQAAVAAREAKVVAELTNQLQRAERTAAEGRDVLTFSRAQLQDADVRVRAKVKAVLDRGACRCADCAMWLSAEWGGTKATTALAEHLGQ